MFDMGPYYLSALINLMGPVRRVTGSHRRTFDRRTITSQPKYGTVIEVEVSTHVAGVLDFESGAIATIVTSFDVWGSDLPHIEVYGTEGALSVPDPNVFEGAVRVRGAGEDGWTDVPLAYRAGGRGMGPAEMAWAIRGGRRPRADGRLANHVLDVMHAVHEASDSGTHAETTTTCERPATMPVATAGGRLRPMTDAFDSGERKLVPRQSRLAEGGGGRVPGADPRHAAVEVRPVTPDRWDDLLRVFGLQRRPGRVLVHGLASQLDRAETDPGGGSPREARGAGRRGHAHRPAGVHRRRARRLVQRGAP